MKISLITHVAFDNENQWFCSPPKEVRNPSGQFAPMTCCSNVSSGHFGTDDGLVQRVIQPTGADDGLVQRVIRPLCVDDGLAKCYLALCVDDGLVQSGHMYTYICEAEPG